MASLPAKTTEPKNHTEGSSGFTLLETVVSLGIFMLVMASASNLMVYATKRSSEFSVKNEIFENARIALEVMDSKIKASSGYSLVLDGTGSLKKLTVTIPEVSPQSFEFVKTPGIRYHRVEFGGNELASYVADVKITVDEDLMTIVLYTDHKLSEDAGIIVEPSVFVKKVNLTGKNRD